MSQIFVLADLESCAAAASDLDNYIKWCKEGGMKRVEVLTRYEDGETPSQHLSMQHLDNC